MVFLLIKIFWVEIKKKGNKGKKQTKYLLFIINAATVSLPQLKTSGLHRFHNIIIAVTIIRFPREEKFRDLFSWNFPRCPVQLVQHPDIFWYRVNGMDALKNAPTKVLVTLFPYTFHVKTNSNIVYKYLKPKSFQETQISFPKCIKHQIFLTLSYNYWGFWVSLNYPILNFKKTICPKNVWMRHWQFFLSRWTGSLWNILQRWMNICKQKQVSRGVLAFYFIEITLWHGYSPVNLLRIFRTLFPKNTSGWLLLLWALNWFLTHYSPVSHFYTPWKRQETFGFLTFSGGIEMWHWTKMG